MFSVRSIINIKCDIGQQKPGIVRTKKEIEELFSKKIPIIRIPRVWFHNGSHQKILETCIKQQQMPPTLFLGGDHFASYFTVLSSLAIYGNNFHLVWLDAHGDIHNIQTSPSKNLHGMPVRMLLEHTIPGILRLKPNQIIYIGIRDLESPEWAYIHQHRIKYIDAEMFHKEPKKAFQQIQTWIHKPNWPIHWSLDVDVLDPSIMPTTGTLAKNGLSLDDISYLYYMMAKNITAIDIMEYNPTLGTNSQKKIGKNTISKLFSQKI